MADFKFIEVQTQITAITGVTQEEILQCKVVKNNHAAASLHRFEDAGVIAVIVTHVINDRVKVVDPAQD